MFWTLVFLDPGTNTVTTARHLLHTAPVCCTASHYPSHYSGPAQWDACRHVSANASPTPQQYRHGDGSRHHHGHVSWWASVYDLVLFNRYLCFIAMHTFEAASTCVKFNKIIKPYNIMHAQFAFAVSINLGPILCCESIRYIILAHWCSLCGHFFFLGTLLTTQSPASVAPHQVTMPTYRHPGTPGYGYVPPQWWREGHASMLFWDLLGCISLIWFSDSLRAFNTCFVWALF